MYDLTSQQEKMVENFAIFLLSTTSLPETVAYGEHFVLIVRRELERSIIDATKREVFCCDEPDCATDSISSEPTDQSSIDLHTLDLDKSDGAED